MNFPKPHVYQFSGQMLKFYMPQRSNLLQYIMASLMLFVFLTCSRNFVLSKDCNVLDFGAVGDGKTLDTTAIQTAMDNCSLIVFPSGYNFLTFPFEITNSNTHLIINSTITAPMDYENWPIDTQYGGTRYLPLITTKYLSNYNSSITGSGLINGNGYYWYPLFKNNTLKYSRPWLMRFYDVTNFTLSNLHLLNSAGFHIYTSGTNIKIHDINITVRNPSNGESGSYSTAPNTDGIDVSGENIHIYNCYVLNGDDSYTMESGSNNVLFENSICVNGFGMAMPSAKGTNDKATQNALYKNMIAINTGYGIKLN